MEAARARAGAGGAPQGDYLQLLLDDAGADETLGACHAIELSYVFNNPQVTIYTGGRYNEKLADTVQEMWVRFARTGDPSADGHVWEPYTADSRKTMLLGEEIGMTEDLKREQRETISPLTHHYFNGCYSQLDLFVPQLGRIVGTVLCVPAVVIAAVVLLRRRKRKKNRNLKTKDMFTRVLRRINHKSGAHGSASFLFSEILIQPFIKAFL
ncbi:MAG: carboxylesterase family protein [Clostridia bacterium]|nr:carboxylesterase family protein [Clostridia bacterium]